jgi:tryptophan 2,3-dioxygenase
MSEIVSSQAIEDLEKKFEAINQKQKPTLKVYCGLNQLHIGIIFKQMHLLNLQIQRTVLPDEMVFIMYHQG